jgi:hypothetical protein
MFEARKLVVHMRLTKIGDKLRAVSTVAVCLYAGFFHQSHVSQF